MVSVLYSEDDLHAYGGFNPCVCVWREVSASAYQHRATSQYMIILNIDAQDSALLTIKKLGKSVRAAYANQQ